MNQEYEYSIKVTDIKLFIDYCINNNYDLESTFSQERTIYKNGGKVMARITKNVCDNKAEEILDFKDDILSNDPLIIRRESKELYINDNNREFVKSLINILDMKVFNKLIRKRYTYKKGNVKFEIDDYIEPKAQVVAIEGLKEETDKVYNDIVNNYSQFIIKE